ncbi:MAG: hypothetical protein AAGA54_21355 [Myxococcota bacterium]
MGSTVARAVAGAIACLLAGCSASAFSCQEDAQCEGLVDGRCELNGYCSLPDEECVSGRRYGDLAPDTVAGRCVPSDDEGSTGGTTGTPPGSTTSTGPSLTTSTSTTGLTTAQPATTTDALGSSGVEDDTSTGDPVPEFYFDDDFDRPNDSVVGNGWFEKTPTAFGVRNGTLTRESGNTEYPANAVYRPDERLEAVEVQVEFHYEDDVTGTFPQLYARIDEARSEEPGLLAGYYVYVPEGGSVAVGRLFSPDNVIDFDVATLDQLLTAGERYRIRLAVSGSNPVLLIGALDQYDGATWVEIVSVAGMDASEDRLGPGTFGISGGPLIDAYAYDRFTVREL